MGRLLAGWTRRTAIPSTSLGTGLAVLQLKIHPKLTHCKNFNFNLTFVEKLDKYIVAL
jgi:hypothetical protein